MLVMQALMERMWPLAEVKLPAWKAKGSCRGSDTLVFYPPSDDDALAAPAKEICAGCPVRKPCLEFALSTREKHGVWGGLTERERRRVLRQRRRSA
jgi:WhiB family redox-sensing transcriptional regulator